MFGHYKSFNVLGFFCMLFKKIFVNQHDDMITFIELYMFIPHTKKVFRWRRQGLVFNVQHKVACTCFPTTSFLDSIWFFLFFYFFRVRWWWWRRVFKEDCVEYQILLVMWFQLRYCSTADFVCSNARRLYCTNKKKDFLFNNRFIKFWLCMCVRVCVE